VFSSPGLEKEETQLLDEFVEALAPAGFFFVEVQDESRFVVANVRPRSVIEIPVEE
jgi:hypothetical protein